MACKCSDYSAGMLRTDVVFQRVTKTTDGAGGYTDAWAAISGAPTRAHVKAVSGSERYNSDRVEAGVRYKVAVRYYSGLTERDAVMIDGKRCNIRFVDNVEFRDMWLVIDADAGAAPE